MFHCGNTLALYNLQYDIDMLNRSENEYNTSKRALKSESECICRGNLVRL